MLQGDGTQTIRNYVARGQATVAEWVATRPILDVCVQDTGFEGGGILRVPWWRQKAAEDHMRVLVEAISEVERVRRQKEYGRHNGSKGGLEGGAWTARSRVVLWSM